MKTQDDRNLPNLRGATKLPVLSWLRKSKPSKRRAHFVWIPATCNARREPLPLTCEVLECADGSFCAWTRS